MITETLKANPLGYEKIGRLIIRFSTPAIASNVLNAVYNTIDQIFIGNIVGNEGIAAISVTFPLMTVVGAIGIMIGIGSASSFNLHQGAGNRDKAEKIAGNGISMLIVSGLLIAVLALLFLKPLLRLFGATPEILGLSSEYTTIIAIGLPFNLLTMGGSMLIRADGSPNWAMFSMVSGAVFNIILKLIFLFVLGWGVRGIAGATVLGQLLSAGVAVAYLAGRMKTVRWSKSSFVVTWSNIKAICALGAAGFANQMAMTLVTIVLNNTLRYYGDLSNYGSTVTLGAVGAITRINMIFLSFVIGLGQGCQPINGFNYGARNYQRVRDTLRTALIINVSIAVTFFALFQIFPLQILSIFGEGSPEYFAFGTRYLRIFLFMTFSNALQPLASGYFTSTGRAKMGIFVSLTRQILFLIPLLLLFPLFFGIDGVVYAGPIADCVAAILSGTFLFREFKRLNGLIKSGDKLLD